MKHLLTTIALAACCVLALRAQTHESEKYRPFGIKDILMLDGDMEYSLQGTLINVPVPHNHNNDFLSITGAEMPLIPQTELKMIYYPTLYIRNTLLDKVTPIDLDEIIYNEVDLKVERPAIADCYITDVTAFNDFLFFVAKTNRNWFTLFFDTKTYDTGCISQSMMRIGLSADKRWIVTYVNEDLSDDQEFNRESVGKLYDFIKRASY